MSIETSIEWMTPEWAYVSPLHKPEGRFSNIFSIDIREEGAILRRKLYLNERPVEVIMACFQGSLAGEPGLVNWHEEQVFELFFPLCGEGAMSVRAQENGEMKEQTTEFRPIFLHSQASIAKYELAIATDCHTRKDNFVVNAVLGRDIYQPQCIITPPMGWHTTTYNANNPPLGIALKYKFKT